MSRESWRSLVFCNKYEYVWIVQSHMLIRLLDISIGPHDLHYKLILHNEEGTQHLMAAPVAGP
jgi:hypothetical protein